MLELRRNTMRNPKRELRQKETPATPVISTQPLVIDPQPSVQLPKALRRMILPKDDTPELLRHDLLEHFRTLGLTNLFDEAQQTVHLPGRLSLNKCGIRQTHQHQRRDYLDHEFKMVGRHWSRLMGFFADGKDIEPKKIKPVLVPVHSETMEAELFRFATTLWSVPVSRGFGRRMRYLVMDEHHGKLMGIFALGDPVYNLRVRDQLIGWNHEDRRDRLVNVMDGYIIGSVPPYSALLGGKLVASLIGSREVSKDFQDRYGRSTGIISQKEKEACLSLITVTSALGRSSIYNRLHLKANKIDKTLVKLDSIGMTDGYGHFHLSEFLFARMRLMLLNENHPYAMGHQFGDGPNWRMRMIRVALQHMGLSPNLIRHGISREVFAMPLVQNYQEVLRDGAKPKGPQRPSVKTISAAALERWVLPRAKRKPEFKMVLRDVYLQEQMQKVLNKS